MQISKYLLAGAIFATGLAPLIGQTSSEEQEDRIQAREELNRKMAELEAQLQATEEPKPLAEEDATKAAEKMVETTTETLTPAESEVAKPAVVEKPVVSKQVEVKPVQVIKPVVVEKPEVAKPVEVVQPIATKPAPAYPPVAKEDAVERARQEMRRKLAEMENQPAPAPKSVTLAPAPKATTPAPVDAAKSSTPVTAPAKTTTTANLDDAAIARARAETRRKIAELDAQEKAGNRPTPNATSSTPTTAPKPVVPAATTAAKPVTPPATPVQTTVKSTPATAAPAKKDARAEAEAQAIKAASTKAAPAPQTAASLIQAPPPAVSVAKQTKLNELLTRYKADKITPEQYHAERARILAE